MRTRYTSFLRRHQPCYHKPGRREGLMTIPHDFLNDLRSSAADLTRTVGTSDAVSVGRVAGWLTAQNVAVVQV